MFSRSIRIVLLTFIFTLVPATAQPAAEVAALKPNAAPSNSTQANSALDVPIESIVASAGGRAILDKDFPGLCNHAMYGFFKTMSLHQIAAMSKGKMTSEMLAQAQTDLSAISLTAAAPLHQRDIDDMSPAPLTSQASMGGSQTK